MSYLHDDQEEETPRSQRERELTLGTGTILAIFFGLVALCGAFFAFGYNMGSKARTSTTASAEAPTATPANFSAFKPAPGSPATQATPVTAESATKSAPFPAPARSETEVSAATTTPAPRASLEAPPAPVVRNTPPPPATRPAPTTPDVTGNFEVQVAAVSHQEDAELLVGALRRKGYAVVSHTEPQDKLFHIQVGPFTSKRDAETMRQRLLADGYNAIVK